MRATFILSALASLALVSATPLGADVLTKRDPSDKSGNTQIALECTGETLPDPGGDGGAGEGGFGYFTSNMKASIKGGDDIGPTACTDKDGTCSNCLFEDSGLSSSINVTGCWNPPRWYLWLQHRVLVQ
ncbi:hypothetical protein N7468_002293 [Penicillium chermesinum]|uniref:Uncharacterized protein n=1 Tax=Penicillium chermesinum TaxID=63820 RepID=A0A9W9PI89_9EURO|nr:uncharacterized protein N7468_002293 [Penicillium chermesinum]KAJ5247310.1 hypothetical protein N7468_002293 [Penicillium chermesinum]